MRCPSPKGSQGEGKVKRRRSRLSLSIHPSIFIIKPINLTHPRHRELVEPILVLDMVGQTFAILHFGWPRPWLFFALVPSSSFYSYCVFQHDERDSQPVPPEVKKGTKSLEAVLEFFEAKAEYRPRQPLSPFFFGPWLISPTPLVWPRHQICFWKAS